MSGACSSLVGEGAVRGVLGAVDCQTRAFAEAGYSSLTATSSTFQIALTGLLTIYVALVGYRMLFAAEGARLSDAPGIALKIGAILALVTSWATFQTLVFDVAAKAPGEIAAAVAGPLQANSGALAADPLSGLQVAYDQLNRSAAAFGAKAGPNAAKASPNGSATDALSTAAGAMFMTTAGVVAAATLAIGVLTAVGPVFVALFLVPATRGLFVGWVRALAAAALVLMLAWLGIVLLLSMLEPWLAELAQQQAAGQIQPQTATSTAALVMVFCAGQAALVIAACVMAFAFRLGRRPAPLDLPRGATAASPGVAPSPLPEPSRAQRLALDLQRDPAGEARLRGLQLASATSTTRTVETRPTARIGDAYRRPAVAARRLKVSR